MVFFRATPIVKPVDVRSFLGKPELHWRKGYSAYELASSWISARGVPRMVRRVLEQDLTFHEAVLVEGLFEHETEIPGGGRPSQTDLLVLLRTQSGYAVLGVEGKVDEAFGPLVNEWFDNTPNRAVRLNGLCTILGLQRDIVSGLRYQLLHRTCATVLEAQRYGVGDAVMLVHSFSTKHSTLKDFQRFSEALGTGTIDINRITPAIQLADIRLRLAWVADRPSYNISERC